MTPPLLTAEATLYQTTTHYATFAGARSGDDISYARFGSTLCDQAYARCAATAQWNVDQAAYRCSLLDGPRQYDCAASARAGLTAALSTCTAQFVCASAEDCSMDRVSGREARCCPGGQACGGRCVPNCPPRKLITLNDSSCTCVCDPFLQLCETIFDPTVSTDFIRDPGTCQCRCLTRAEKPCVINGTFIAGAVRDPSNCVCTCLPPTEPCSNLGFCCNTTTDPRCCGGCGNRCPQGSVKCCPPDHFHATNWCDLPQSEQHCGTCDQAVTCSSTQTCCETATRGVFRCTNVHGNDPMNCGGCRIHCPTGQKCCSGHCRDVQNDPMNCGTCDKVCPAGQTCVGGNCVCPPGQIDCANTGRCCPPTQCCPSGCCPRPGDPAANITCCGGRCSNKNTDPSNCGTCGKVCPAGQTCVGGNCVCPPSQIDCFGVCCTSTPHRFGCCPTGCCPRPGDPAANTICCNGVCRNLADDVHNCGVCFNECHGTTIWFQGSAIDVRPSCQGGQCTCAQGTSRCGSDWCKPDVFPDGSGRSTICCPPAPAAGYPAEYACPAGTTCCNVVQTGTGWKGCC